MKIDVIYTFEDRGQKRATFPFVSAILIDKDTFIEFLISTLDSEERGELIKISTCILTPLAYPITNNYHKDKAHWFNKCSGKIWVDDLEAYRTEKGIKSTVSNTFIKEFKMSNP